MILFTSKIYIFSKIEPYFWMLQFFALLLNCYPVTLRTGHISFLMKYRFCLVLVVSDDRLIFLRYRHRILVEIN